MKNLILHLVLTFCSLSVTAQSIDKSIMLINVYEHWNKTDVNKIIVTENGKMVEEVALDRWVPENLSINQATVNNVLQKYRRMGYQILSQSKGSLTTWGGMTAMVTTFLCEK
jgi:hypothetical protein